MERRRRRGKRQRPQSTAADNLPSSSLSKRYRRPNPVDLAVTVAVVEEEEQLFKSPSSLSPLVMVTGLPSDCTVMELKSRLEMYGPISRTRIDAVDGAGYVTFRSATSAEAAITASLDPAFGVSVGSRKVLVCRAAEHLLAWRAGAGVPPPSKLLRAEIPLSKHGRSNKKLTAATTSIKKSSEPPYKGREIVAYDDLF